MLEPAKYWKDFKDLTIYVELPKKLLTIFSLEGFKLNKETNIYTAHFDKLPDKNLEILVYKNKHIESSEEVHIKAGLQILLIFIFVIVLFIVGVIKLIFKLAKKVN